MNAVTPIVADEGGGRLAGVAAYVLDGDSEATIRRAAAHLALPGFEIYQGGVALAARDLKTKRSPAVLFVDVSDTDMVTDAMQRLSEVCEPQLQVIAIGRKNDVGLYRELLAMGVADYIFKPITTDLVEKLMRRTTGATVKSVATTRQGKLVVVTGARGGVGASSVACNIASYLAGKAERRVVLVDLDLTTGVQALMLNTTPNVGLAEALESPGRIDDLFVERATIGVSLRLDLLASELPMGKPSVVRPEACETLIDRLRKKYFYVVVDLAGGTADAVAQVLLAAADVRLLVTEATLIGARDAGRTPRLADQRTIVVHNKAGRPGDLADKDFAAALQRAPDVSLPYEPKAFGAGINLGAPAWRGGGAIELAVARLTTELTGRRDTDKPSRSPLLKRLIGR